MANSSQKNGYGECEKRLRPDLDEGRGADERPHKRQCLAARAYGGSSSATGEAIKEDQAAVQTAQQDTFARVDGGFPSTQSDKDDHASDHAASSTTSPMSVDTDLSSTESHNDGQASHHAASSTASPMSVDTDLPPTESHNDGQTGHQNAHSTTTLMSVDTALPSMESDDDNDQTGHKNTRSASGDSMDVDIELLPTESDIDDQALANCADQLEVNRALADQFEADQFEADQFEADQFEADQALADQALADQALADQALADQALVDQANAATATAGVSAIVAAPVTPTLPSMRDTLATFDRKFYVVPQGGGTYVIEPNFFDPEMETLCTRYMTTAQFREYTAREWAQPEKGKAVQVGPFWLSRPATRQLNGVVMDPSLPPGLCQKTVTHSQHARQIDVFNTWQGFAVKPEKGDWSLIDKHIREGVANGKSATYEYLLNWIARLVQDPGTKATTALVLGGEQGRGKGTFIKDIVGALFHASHFVQIMRAEQVTGRFNAILKDKVLVFLDEAFFAGDKSHTGVIKTLITETTMPLEPKGKDPFLVKNRTALLMASNNDWVAPVELTNRRFFMVRVNNDATLLTPEYFKALHAQIKNDGLAAFLHAMLERDISEFRMAAFPREDAEEFEWDNVLRTGSAEMRFMHQLLKDADGEASDWMGEHSVPKRQLYDEFIAKSGCLVKFNHESAVHKKLQQFVKLGTKKVASEWNGNRVNAFIFPPLVKCRYQFEKAVGFSAKILWGSD